MRCSSLGAFAAACAVLASGCAPKQQVEDVLVEGEGIRITKKDFDAFVAQVPPFARQQYSDEKLLDLYVKGELAYLEALRTGLDRDPAVRAAIDRTVKQLLQKEYSRREISEKMGIADEEVRAYYEQHKDEFRSPPQRKCWHILTRTFDDAERAREAVLGGEDFRDVAVRYSIDDSTRNKGGLIGIFSREDVPVFLKTRPALVESLFALPPGNLSGVVESDLGFHVLKASPAKRIEYLPLQSVARGIRDRMLVPDSLVQQYYDSHRESFRSEDKAQVRVVVVAQKAQAEGIRDRIARGEDMAALAREFSTDTRSRSRGGLLDWVRRGIRRADVEPELEAAVWDVLPGEVGPVVKTAKGYVVFRVEQREYEGPKPLDEVRDRIRGQLLVGAREQAMERSFDVLKQRYKVRERQPGKRAAVRAAPASASSGQRDRAAMTEEELFALAAQESTAAARMEIYQDIVKRFPDGQRADDSQFMIGFVLMDELRDTSAALQAYGELIRRFPKSDWVDDAQAMIDLVKGGQGPSSAGASLEKAANAGDPTR